MGHSDEEYCAGFCAGYSDGITAVKADDIHDAQKAIAEYEGAKDTEGKPDYTLVPIKGLCDGIEAVRQFGKQKYPDPQNWRKVPSIEFWRAFLRHTVKAWEDPMRPDEESGLPHCWHAAFNLACFLELMES